MSYNNLPPPQTLLPFRTVPQDNPLYGQLMIEKWVEEAVQRVRYTRDQEVTPADEIAFGNPDEGPNANPSSWWARRQRQQQQQ